MESPGFLSPAQLAGYLAFVLGVVSFLQKDDRRLKAMVGLQAFSYAVHFYLLGSAAAVAASLVTTVRALLSLRTRSPAVAVAILAVNVLLGVATVRSAVGLLPITATTAGTIAFFFFDGIPLRLILLGSTACWLTNNVLLGSIGGTLLELFIGVSNVSTCYRLWRARPLPPPASIPPLSHP
ncbi:MAG TPA: YgjV family protein [Polyangiaceae bacterium]|nr:YgjV family protein [Polyangiaceae bacterium]